INFTEYGLPEYRNRYALVIDNLFTREECERLLALVPSEGDTCSNTGDESVGGAWLVAGIGETIVIPSYRNSGRIVRNDAEIAAWILEKIRPCIGEIEEIPDAHLHRGYSRRHSAAARHGETEQEESDAIRPARLKGLREDLRFLRYTSGQFFKPHKDGSHIDAENKEISYYTLQLYLNGDAKTLKGGATRFWPCSTLDGLASNGTYVDVEPRMGRVLIFEQRDLKHSGEDVKEGVKYNIRADMMYVEVDKPE
ncbi:uncharacterized protein EI90DRAFT_2889645, partial [Cantharellus anzutake]|uniref:uncharacterized protein n=1 Tax=Cantharellus anzutake TaxID=1750568 RepID=UPI00190307C0